MSWLWDVGLAILSGVAEGLVEPAVKLIRKVRGAEQQPDGEDEARVFPETCGDSPLPLGNRRFFITRTFGSYFAGLLESGDAYVHLPEQIEALRVGSIEGLNPLQTLMMGLAMPTGPRIVVIAGDGGIGKTTLLTKVVRCLLQQHYYDRIIGDSAKPEVVDLVTGEVKRQREGLIAVEDFYQRLFQQLAMPPLQAEPNEMLQRLNDRLATKRVLIVVDNLDTLKGTADLIGALVALTGETRRAIVTTRTIADLDLSSSAVVRLQPIRELDSALSFLRWHLRHQAHQLANVEQLEAQIHDRGLLRDLLKKTGGVPLVMQIVVNTIPRHGWAYVRGLPQMPVNDEFLAYLYEERWRELDNGGAAGRLALDVLRYVLHHQSRGERITSEKLGAWATYAGQEGLLAQAIRMLMERFLLVNRDLKLGDYAMVPALAEFIRRKQALG